MQVYTYTDIDPGTADSYTVRVTANVYMTDSSGTATLVDSLVGQGAEGDYSVEVSDEFAAYPGVSYSASATQFLSYSISDPAYGSGYYDDPYGFDALAFVESGTGLVTFGAPYPYQFQAVPRSGRSVSRATATPAPVPPEGLNISQNGTQFVTPGTDPTNGSCPTSNPEAIEIRIERSKAIPLRAVRRYAE